MTKNAGISRIVQFTIMAVMTVAVALSVYTKVDEGNVTVLCLLLCYFL